MKSLIYILIFSTFLSCSTDSIDSEPLTELEKAVIESSISSMNQDSISVFYEKMLAMSKQTINLSTKEAVCETPLYKEVYSFFQNNLDNFPLLFNFILYDKRCTGEIQSNARLLLWEVADSNFKTVTEEIKEELHKQKRVVDGVHIIPSEVLFDFDIRLIKALLPNFE